MLPHHILPTETKFHFYSYCPENGLYHWHSMDESKAHAAMSRKTHLLAESKNDDVTSYSSRPHLALATVSVTINI